MYRTNRGITLVALVITIIIMMILVGVSISIGSSVINKSQLEDIKTNMLTIQGKAKSIAEKYSFDPSNTDNQLVGTEIDVNDMPPGLQDALKNNSTADVYYKWTQEDLNNQGLNNIKSNDSKFYIVDYTNNEVFYSLGYKEVYDLTTLETM